ncbi:hypothetical protein BDN67DRAFT_961615 [Paxillus ammoniavirescens]|nr:hypothetical protein BDN67DRAFT_961615 [Paxillus ammoniavirescens]
MRVLLQQFVSCKTCEKACRAAVAMLEVWPFPRRVLDMVHSLTAQYKCNRIPRTIDHLPREYQGN